MMRFCVVVLLGLGVAQAEDLNPTLQVEAAVQSGGAPVADGRARIVWAPLLVAGAVNIQDAPLLPACMAPAFFPLLPGVTLQTRQDRACVDVDGALTPQRP